MSSCRINIIIISILQVPSDYNIVGVSRLQLCDGQQWKDTVDVCLELLSPRNQGPNSAQGQNCSFGMMKFERRPRPRPAAVVDGSALEPCRPQRGLCSIASSVCSGYPHWYLFLSAANVNQTTCCNQEYSKLLD